MHQPVFHALVLLVLTPLLFGCGPSGRPKVETAPVSGTIQLDGQPLSGAEVNFLTDEYAGVATTDASGNYELEAQPGENVIYVVKYDSSDPEYDETMVGGDQPGGDPKQTLPKKFSDPEASELRFTVPDTGSSEANFDLTSR